MFTKKIKYMTQDKPTIEDVLKKHIDAEKEKHCGIVFKHDETIYAAMQEYASLNRQGWTRVEDGLPEEGQIVDIWEMPMTQHLERALSLKGTSYANEYYHDTDYNGWRSTNFKFSIEDDGEGKINCFTKCNPRYFTTPNGGAEYKKLCVENGEVKYWMPLPNKPSI